MCFFSFSGINFSNLKYFLREQKEDIFMRGIQLCNVELTVEEAFCEFLAAKRRDNISPKTIQDYEMMFKIFAKYQDNETLCINIDKNIYEGYKEYLIENQTNVNTINTYLRHMRAVFNFYIEEGYTRPFKMTLIKADETIKEVYTDIEIEKMLKRPDIQKCGFAEYRTWVVVNYILGTGNRLNNVRNLLIRDIDFENNMIFLTRTKNRRQYNIPLSDTLSQILVEYLHFRKGRPEDFLFCTETGEQMTTSGFQSAIKRYNTKRGVKKTSEHLLRHTFAKLYYINGGDLVSLNYILGHKDIKMTRHYLNLLCVDISNTYNQANPLENFKRKQKLKMKN